MAKALFTNPTEDQFKAPPSWFTSGQTFLVWPERQDNWRMGAKPAQNALTKLINELINYEPITLLVSKQQFQNAKHHLDNRVRILEMSTNDVWIKDYGPLFLINTEKKLVRGCKSNFNAWGEIYSPYHDDNDVAYKLFELEQIDYYNLPFMIEWGMILLDGKGTCFASEEGIISEIKNKHLTKEQVDLYLKKYLNINNIIWIPFGLPYDQTKGRLDNIMTIVNETTILCNVTTNESDERYKACKLAYNILKNCKNSYGKKYDVIKIPLPKILPRTTEELIYLDNNQHHKQNYWQEPLSGSYTNLYLGNNVILVPTFNDKDTEEQAINIIARVFPDKRIILIPSREFVLGRAGISGLICKKPFV